MTFHRTAGKGGTRNSPRERHATDLPNFNKSTSGGHSRTPSRGRTVHNPPSSATKRERRQRYDNMMAGKPDWTVQDEVDAKFASRVPRFLGGIGRGVTGKRGKYR